MVIGAVVVRHPDCGQLVEVLGDVVEDLDGGEHMCRDYVAWHDPVDGRDPDGLDVAGGWRPAPAARMPVG